MNMKMSCFFPQNNQNACVMLPRRQSGPDAACFCNTESQTSSPLVAHSNLAREDDSYAIEAKRRIKERQKDFSDNTTIKNE